jgi:hypothetical protein
MSRSANLYWPDSAGWKNLSAVKTLFVSLGICCGMMFVSRTTGLSKRR